MRSEFEGQLKLLLIEGGIDDTAFVFEEVLDEGDFGTDENGVVGAHVGSDGTEQLVRENRDRLAHSPVPLIQEFLDTHDDTVPLDSG